MYKLIEEHFELVNLIEKWGLKDLSTQQLDKWHDRCLYHVKKVNELTKDNERLQSQLIEYQRVTKQKQEYINELVKGHTQICMENDQLRKELVNPPLKFEELKPKMYVWDN